VHHSAVAVYSHSLDSGVNSTHDATRYMYGGMHLLCNFVNIKPCKRLLNVNMSVAITNEMQMVLKSLACCFKNQLETLRVWSFH